VVSVNVKGVAMSGCHVPCTHQPDARNVNPEIGIRIAKMSRIGDIASGHEIGYKANYYKYIYVACPRCGTERWKQFVHAKAVSAFCQSCANHKSSLGELNNMWRGGKTNRKDGYISVIVAPDDFFSKMTNSGNYILEHRLIMAKHVGRCLLPWEVVHHKNGIRNDNRIENLELLPSGRWHLVDQVTKQYIKRLENKIEKLQLELKKRE